MMRGSWWLTRESAAAAAERHGRHRDVSPTAGAACDGIGDKQEKGGGRKEGDLPIPREAVRSMGGKTARLAGPREKVNCRPLPTRAPAKTDWKLRCLVATAKAERSAHASLLHPIIHLPYGRAGSSGSNVDSRRPGAAPTGT